MGNDPREIFLVGGARPNFMKIAPIARELDKYKKEFVYKIIHTGQHYDREMSEVFFKELGIRKSDRFLGVGSGTHARQTARILVAFEDVCIQERQDLVMLVGDVNSTLACSITAKKLQIPIAHVEAGLRSFDMSMPEEINRIVTDSISDYFFVTEKSGIDNLIAEGKSKDSIFFVGNVMIDNLFYQLKKLNQIDQGTLSSTSIKQRLTNYGVVTLHRPSNVDNKETLERIISALSLLSDEVPLVFPIHPRTEKKFEKFNIHLKNSIIVTNPLSYMDFLNLWKDASLVLTDSGGIQEETTALGIPCLTLRENTERPITVSEGTNVIVGNSPSEILEEAEKILKGKGKKGKKPELWDGKASERIVDIIKKKMVRI